MFYLNFRTSNNKYVPEISKKKPLDKRSRFTAHEQKVFLEMSKKYGIYVAEDDQSMDEQFQKYKVCILAV